MPAATSAMHSTPLHSTSLAIATATHRAQHEVITLPRSLSLASSSSQLCRKVSAARSNQKLAAASHALSALQLSSHLTASPSTCKPEVRRSTPGTFALSSPSPRTADFLFSLSLTRFRVFLFFIAMRSRGALSKLSPHALSACIFSVRLSTTRASIFRWMATDRKRKRKRKTQRERENNEEERARSRACRLSSDEV